MKGQQNLATTLDSLNLDIEALENDNSTLQLEIQERLSLKQSPLSNLDSSVGRSSHFNLKAELERASPGLLNIPLESPTNTFQKRSSVAGNCRHQHNLNATVGASRRKNGPKPKPLIHSVRNASESLQQEIAQSNGAFDQY